MRGVDEPGRCDRAVGALGIYVLVRASGLVAEERALVGYGHRYAQLRLWGHRLGGVLLLAGAVALFIGGLG